MKSIARLRAALLAANLLLVAALFAAAHAVFFTRSDPHLPAIPMKERAVAAARTGQLAEYEVIWKEIDRVPPPAEPPPPPPPAAPGVSDLVRVAFAAEDTSSPRDRICILQRVGAAEQIVLRAGESASGFTCEAIEREGADLVAVVKGASGPATRLRVKRDPDGSQRP